MASTRFGINAGQNNSQVVKNQTAGTSNVEILVDNVTIKNKVELETAVQKIVEYIIRNGLI